MTFPPPHAPPYEYNYQPLGGSEVTERMNLFHLPLTTPNSSYGWPRPRALPRPNIETNKYLELGTNKTSPSPLKKEIREQLQEIVIRAKAEADLFETGETTQFSQNLMKFIQEYRDLAIDALRETIDARTMNTIIAGETLRSIGEIDNPPLSNNQIGILTYFLSNPSPRIRDGAIMGLSSMNTPTAIEPLSSALQEEKDEFLKHVIQKVLQQLRKK